MREKVKSTLDKIDEILGSLNDPDKMIIDEEGEDIVSEKPK